MADEDIQTPVDLGDAKSVKEKRRLSKQAAAARKEVLRTFMSSPGGRKWFYDFLVAHSAYTNPFRRDPYITAFECGELNVAQQVMAEIVEADEVLYLQMLKENKDAQDS